MKSCNNLLIQNVYMSRAMLKSIFYKEWCDTLCYMNLHCLFLLLLFFIIM